MYKLIQFYINDSTPIYILTSLYSDHASTEGKLQPLIFIVQGYRMSSTTYFCRPTAAFILTNL